MKRSVFTIIAAAVLTVSSTTVADAQMINQTNLESYAKSVYGNNLEKAALNMSNGYQLDNQGNMVFTKEISAPTMTKDELYMEMANWFVCNYDNSIQFADKETGTLIARPFIQNIARSAGGFNAYNVSIYPTIRANVSDGKVDITYTLHDYNVMVEKGGGNTANGLLAGLTVAAVAGTIADACSSHTTEVVEHHGFGRFHTTTVYREYHPHHLLSDAILLSCIASTAAAGPSKDSKTWSLSNCYPFVSKDNHKKASGKAFVMANVYSQVVMNNIEAALNQCSLAYNK